MTGRKDHSTGKTVEIEKYDQALQKLFDEKLISQATRVTLFNWGEPTIHPQFGEIVDITQNKHGLSYNISTNAGKPIDYQPEWFKKLASLRISMCGFSQESYDKIHQFDLEKVKSNIISIVQTAKKAKYNTQAITITHHIYQFNLHEILPLYEFAKKLNVSYSPTYRISIHRKHIVSMSTMTYP